MSAATHRRIVLARRPVGAPTLDCFRLEEGPVPAAGPGEVLLETLYLSLDPYMRGRMSDGPSYAEPVAVGGTMVGGTVNRVLVSNVAGYAPGDVVMGYAGWQTHAVVAPGASPTSALVKLDPAVAPPSWSLGVLGMPGLTAYVGLLDLGQPQPGNTVVVASATGPVGATVGQIAKLKGCRVVGIAGGADKCDYAVKELGFDACLDHHRDDLATALKAACPQGIDVYFENVGGKVLQAVLPLLTVGARVPVCGVIAWYNLTQLPDGPDLSPVLMRNILTKRVKVQGFIVSDHYDRLGAFHRDMAGWVRSGQVKYREDLRLGLDAAPAAFLGLLEGRNFGKVVVQVQS
jgi:NADPH-dependent curcumin reductase